MTITFNITADDLVEASSQLLRSDPSKAVPVPRYPAIGLICCSLLATVPVGIAVACGTFPQPFDVVLRVMLAGALLWTGFTAYVLIREFCRIRRHLDPVDAHAAAMRQRIQVGDLRPELGRHTITLTTDGFECITADVRFVRKWRSVQFVGDLPDYLALCTSPSSCVPVPKRAFSDLAAAQEFLAEARRMHDSRRPDNL